MLDVSKYNRPNTGLFKVIVAVLTTCHTQYTWDRSIYVFFLFNRTTLQVFVTHLTDVLYVSPLWLYKHQHDNRVSSKQSVACQRWWFEWRFLFVPSVPGYLREEEEHKPDPWCNLIERNHMGLHLENEVAVVNPSAWGHLNPSSYCDVGRLFTGYLNYGLNCREKKWRNNF